MKFSCTSGLTVMLIEVMIIRCLRETAQRKLRPQTNQNTMGPVGLRYNASVLVVSSIPNKHLVFGAIRIMLYKALK